jgi:hypothetical protein
MCLLARRWCSGYETPRPPNKVTAYARSLLGLTPEGYAHVGSHQYRLVVHGSGVERTIPAELPPREYLVSGNVEDLQGEINYPLPHHGAIARVESSGHLVEWSGLISEHLQ